MISRRAPRHADATETLRQHVLNFQKGVDSTRPITDAQTVYAAENLKRNPDGTLSIRKPIIAVDNSSFYVSDNDTPTYFRTHTAKYLYDNASKIVTDPMYRRFTIVDETGDLSQYPGQLNLRWTDMDGVKHYKYWSDVSNYSLVFDNLENMEVINTTSSSIVCGLAVNALAYVFLPDDPAVYDRGDSTLVDTTLYYHDTVPEALWVFRYLKISYEKHAGGEKKWHIDIINPEINTLTVAESDIPLKANLTLDNAYAMRDQYLSTSPTVKAIMPYTFSSIWKDKPVLDLDYFMPWHDTVSQLTESCGRSASRPIYTIGRNENLDGCDIYLKAFCSFPERMVKSYATVNISEEPDQVTCGCWEYTSDGVTWKNAYPDILGDDPAGIQRIGVWEPDENYNPKEIAGDQTTPTDIKYVRKDYFYDDGVLSETNGTARVDILNLMQFADTEKKRKDRLQYRYRFRLVGIRLITKEDDESRVVEDWTAPYYKKIITYGQVEYSFALDNETVFVYNELGNSVDGKHLYHNKTLYSYGGKDQFNNILVSDVGSFITPLTNTIDLNAAQDTTVTALIPWRDYLIAATNSALYLIQKTENGFVTKTINASTGIPEFDAKCCKAILNGVIFKSGAKVYMLYPNMYSGTDSTLNLTDISLPVEDYLLESLSNHDADPPFAFSTDSEYVLMMTSDVTSDTAMTTCLRYEYSTRVWTVDKYPIAAHDYKFFDINNIRLFGYIDNHKNYVEYYFDKTYEELFPDTDFEHVPYGDILESNADLEEILKHWDTTNRIRSIKFMLDTGQKSDSISLTKQFVETKIMLSNTSAFTKYPITLTIMIDGDPHVIVKDLNTDQPNWTKNVNDIGVANTNIFLSANKSEPKDVLRQFIFRYSGKGKSIRHIIEGTSLYNFRVHEILIRFKLLNVKQ